MNSNNVSYQKDALIAPSGFISPGKHLPAGGRVELLPCGALADSSDDSDQQYVDNEPILIRHVSLELLNPTHDCHTRKSSTMVAVINLVATVCGGGVLSLPLAFRRAGIIPTTILMIYGCVVTDFSLYILTSCARRTGGRSYGDVAKAAFGNAAEVATTSLMGLMLLGSLTAYLVLVKDIWTPVLMSLLPDFLKQYFLEEVTSDDLGIDGRSDDNGGDIVSKKGGNLLLLCILIAGAPLLLKRDLYALRHTCYVGFLSCTTLVLAVVYRAFTSVSSGDSTRPALNWYSTNISDLSFAFPIVVLCFLCSYNVLSVHSSLLNPTRERVKFVLDSTMLVCCSLFYLAGLGGYIYALDETCDNILLNFSLDDPAIFLPRMGYCFTLLFGLPLITLPCREAWLAVPGQIHAWRMDAVLAKEFKDVDKRRKQGAHLVINGVDFDGAEPFLVTEDPEKQHQTMLTYGSEQNLVHVIGSTDKDDNDTEETYDEGILSQDPEDEEEEKKALETFVHFGSTFAVVGLCYTFAISVPGVGFVWAICGSLFAIVIAFVIPTACYLKIRKHKRRNPRSVSAWALLLISLVVASVCTKQAIVNS